MNRQDPPNWPWEVQVNYATPAAPTRAEFHVRGWAAYMSITLAVLQIPWDCCGVGRVVFDQVGGSWWANEQKAFVIGRAVLLAPAILGVILGCLALLGSRAGLYRTVARIGVGCGAFFLLLFYYAARWHAGD